MLALLDLQTRLHDALVSGKPTGLAWMLGGARATRRLAIHQRQYTASLVRAVLDRFPATRWLAGTPWMSDAAHAFVRAQPPSRPCIAEYGDTFPAFAASRPGSPRMPYLRQFAELEWHVGRLALAIDRPPLGTNTLRAIAPAELGEAAFMLQPDLHYVEADWALDELLALYLSNQAPERFVLQQELVWLELRGARGDLRIRRVTRAEFTFRAALAAQRPLADAATAALEVDSAFDPGCALLDIVRAGLVASVSGVEAEQ